jgi:hypothetical protein
MSNDDYIIYPSNFSSIQLNDEDGIFTRFGTHFVSKLHSSLESSKNPENSASSPSSASSASSANSDETYTTTGATTASTTAPRVMYLRSGACHLQNDDRHSDRSGGPGSLAEPTVHGVATYALEMLSAAAEKVKEVQEAEKADEAQEDAKEAEKAQEAQEAQEKVEDSIIKSMRTLIMEEKEIGVTLRNLSSLEKEPYFLELCKRSAKCDFQKHLLEKIKFISKLGDVDDWNTAWSTASEPIPKSGPLSSYIQNQSLYKVYAELCRPISQEELDKLLHRMFPSNHKAIENVIQMIKNDVYNEIEGKACISIVKYHKFQSLIVQSLIALGKQEVYASILAQIYNVNHENMCSLNTSKVLSMSELDEWTLLQAYQFLQGVLNEIHLINSKVDLFANWYRNLSV